SCGPPSGLADAGPAGAASGGSYVGDVVVGLVDSGDARLGAVADGLPVAGVADGAPVAVVLAGVEAAVAPGERERRRVGGVVAVGVGEDHETASPVSSATRLASVIVTYWSAGSPLPRRLWTTTPTPASSLPRSSSTSAT